jgi:hypothetical protein
MKKLWILFLTPVLAWADTSSLNLGMPAAPQTYQTDRFRAGDMDCQSAIGSSTNIEFGVMGVINRTDPYEQIVTGSSENRDVGVYARITIPIGAPKERINCNALFNLELERRRMEVQKLRQELEELKNLKFEK